MEVIKGYARRTTQSIRERISGASTSAEEQQLLEGEEKVRRLEASSRTIGDKLIKMARLIEEIGVTMKEIGDEYKQVPDLVDDSQRICQDVLAVGAKLTAAAREQQQQLSETGFRPIQEFSRSCAKLSEAEKLRQQHHLELDFFKRKVQQLRTTPQRDCSRLPRNEQRLHTWRVEVWRSSEICRALTSELYVLGRRAIDTGVLTVAGMVQNYFTVGASETSVAFHSLHLPEYQTEPVLPPLPAPQQDGRPRSRRGRARGGAGPVLGAACLR
ncbi:hypothetical protein STCU_09275 [Strigomonas culicis]|uniref:Uncharacterized protein n=1 Tax=Strigomonas culicis TaxID=28005 RepID=S9TTH1_9TRYP|nr:hypothetical protein STCU_09275 [Strigomonas culicis]|eukprot:EPY19828.1 hypothetical protein STCU_09275 [Strigomonas culicis]